MQRSRDIFLKISVASKSAVAAANGYARRKDECGVPRAHFQLETEVRRICVACECIVDLLGRLTLPDGPAFDSRLQDWLGTDEPRQCLDTLIRIETMFSSSWVSWVPRMFGTGRDTAHTEDKIKDAAEYLGSRKHYFHFLFSTEIWNNEAIIQQRQDRAQRESEMLKQSFPTNTAIQTGSHAAISHRQQANYDNLGSLYLQNSVQLDTGTTPNTVTPENIQTVDHAQEMATDDEKTKTEKGNPAIHFANTSIERKLEGIVNWLDGTNCAEKQDDTLSLRQPDTCKWLFDTARYKSWRDGHISFLWLRGKPGAGKSVLASSVINSLKSTEREALAFFYCDFRNGQSTNSAEALRSILSQLLRKVVLRDLNIAGVLHDLDKAKEWGGSTRKNAKELAGFTCRVAALSLMKPLVVIDALDECRDVGNLIQACMVLKDHVRLFVTSRPLNLIMEDLSGLPFISMDDMEDELSADIQLHVTRELDARHRLRALRTEFKSEIRSVLCAKACGMFRWIQCSLDTLSQCVTRTEVRSALDSLPEGLDETYERILVAIDPKSRTGQLAQRALNWLVAALRPLRLDELVEGLSINLRTRNLDPDFGPMHHGALLDACGSLVTYTEKTGIIILSHFSVKEYLIGQLILTKIPQYHINWELAHLHLARSCLCYLSTYLNSFLESSAASPHDVSSIIKHRARLISQPLLDYILNDAIEHFQYLGLSQFESVLCDISMLTRGIQQQSRTWDNLCRSARRTVDSAIPNWPLSKHDLMLYLLVVYAPSSLLNIVLHPAMLNAKAGTNPLIYAAYFNKEKHARILLSRGVKLNRRGWDVNGFFRVLPIEVALLNRHYPLVTLFIQEESTIPSYIFIASSFEVDDLEMLPSSIVRMLFQTDDFAEAANDPLDVAIRQLVGLWDSLSDSEDVGEHDLTAILRRIIQAVDNDLARNDQGRRLLDFAIERGSIPAIRYLLTRGAFLPSDVLLYGPWIWISSETAFLVENGANVHARTPTGESVLHIALQVTHIDAIALESVKILIGHGCDPVTASARGETPLHIAVRRGFVAVTQYLLSLGVFPPPDLLHLAIVSHWQLPKLNRSMIYCLLEYQVHMHTVAGEPMIDCLLEYGVDVHTHTAAGESVLHSVLQASRDEDTALKYAKVLVGRGCNPVAASACGETPLHIAVRRGFISVTQYLLSLSVFPPPDLLHLAFVPHRQLPTFNKSMIGFLLEYGVDVHMHTAAGESVLHSVLQASRDEDTALKYAKVLIDRGCNPATASACGETPLHITVRQGFISVTQYLLSLGIFPPSDLLHLAFVSHQQLPIFNKSMIDFLLEYGVDASRDEDTALKYAKVLVGRGCDPVVASACGETPLHIAVRRGFISATQYILSLSISPPPDLLHLAFVSWLPMFNSPRAAGMIDCLLEYGVDVHVHTTTGESVLHTAMRASCDKDIALKIAKVLIGHGCNPHAANASGETPLHIAVKRGFFCIAQYSLSPSFDWNAPRATPMLMNQGTRLVLENEVDIPSSSHTTEFEAAPDLCSELEMEGFYDEDYILEVFKDCVSRGGDPFATNTSGNTPVRVATERGFVAVTRYILSLSDISPYPDLLHVALQSKEAWGQMLENRRWEIMMILCLLENGADVRAGNAAGNSVLYTALRSLPRDGFNLEDVPLTIVKILVSHGCNPLEITPSGQSLVHIAVERGFVSVARYLLSLGAPAPSGLLVAAHLRSPREATQKVQILHCLLENGTDVHACTAAGYPLLHVALESFELWEEEDILEALKLLVRYGCDHLECNSEGKTPLYIAVERGYLSVAKFLLSLGEPPSFPSDLLWAAMRSEARSSKSDMISFLIDQGANVLERAQNGDSVLHIAVASINDSEVFRILLTQGCDPIMPNDSGTTPFHIAVQKGHISIVKLFLSQNIQPPPDILFAAIESTLLNSEDRLKIIETLVTSGCDTQSRNAVGETPLEAAFISNQFDVVAYLLLALEDHSPFVAGSTEFTCQLENPQDASKLLTDQGVVEAWAGISRMSLTDDTGFSNQQYAMQYS